MAGAKARKDEEFEIRKWLVWHGAALPTAKRFPTLKAFVGRKSKPQTQNQMLQIARMWDAAIKEAEKR